MKQSAFEPKLHREESKLARLEAKLERQTPGSWRHNRTQEKIARQTKIVTPLRRAVRDFQRELKEIHAVSTDEEALARIDHDEELYSTVASMLRTKSREQKQKRKAAAWGSLELRDALTLEGEALEPLSRLGSRQRKRHFGEAIDGVAEGITKLLNPPVQEIDHLPKLDLEHLLEDTKVSIKELEKGLSEAAGAIDNSEGTPQGVGGVLVNFVPNPLRAQLDQKRKLSSAIRLKLKKLAADKPPKPAPTRAEKEIRRQYAKIQDIAELRKANEDLCQQFPELEELIKRLFYEKEIEILERS